MGRKGPLQNPAGLIQLYDTLFYPVLQVCSPDRGARDLSGSQETIGMLNEILQ
jgi:hypothetical protein